MTEKSKIIHRGFNRAGLAIAGSLIAYGLLGIGPFASPGWTNQYKLDVIVGFTFFAVIAYVVCRALGWVIAGFMGD